MTKLNVDRRPSDDDLPDDMPSLWAPRGVPSMTATKIGWGTGLCGAAARFTSPRRSTPSCIALRVELIAIVREALATTEPHRKEIDADVQADVRGGNGQIHSHGLRSRPLLNGVIACSMHAITPGRRRPGDPPRAPHMTLDTLTCYVTQGDPRTTYCRPHCRGYWVARSAARRLILGRQF
jgi:hypothetical protein